MKKLFILCLTALLLVGCGSGTTENDTTADTTAATDTTTESVEETEDTSYLDAVGERDYGGRDFRFFCSTMGRS